MSLVKGLCTFCYRQYSETSAIISDRKTFAYDPTLEKFGKFIERYFGESFHLFQHKERELFVVEACEDCSSIMKGFCELYHELKCLKMKVEWKLRKLRDVMNTADQVQSREFSFQARFIETDKLDNKKALKLVTRHRKKFKEKCQSHVAKSAPKAVLVRKCLQELSRAQDQSENDSRDPVGELSSTKFKLSSSVVHMLRNGFGKPIEPASEHVESLCLNEDMDDSFNEEVEMESSSCQFEAFTQLFLSREREVENRTPATADIFMDSKLVSHSFEKPIESKKSSSEESHKKTLPTTQNVEKNIPKKRKTDLIHSSKKQKAKWRKIFANQSFNCHQCNRKFNSFKVVKRHQRAFTHVLKKKKAILKLKGQAKSKTTTIQRRITDVSKIKAKIKAAKNTLNNTVSVGVLRPLRRTTNCLVYKEDESDEKAQESDDYDGRAWNSSSSDCDDDRFQSSKNPHPHFKTKRRDSKKVEIQLAVHSKNRHAPNNSNSSHSSLKNTERPFRCKCKKRFETEEQLEVHQKLHGSFPCSSCSLVKNYAPKLALHEASHSSSNENSKSRHIRNKISVSCPKCDTIIKGELQYISHYLETHLGLPRDGLRCRSCSAEFTLPSHLKNHIKINHSIEGIPPQDVRRCDLCPVFFGGSFLALARHKKRVHGHVQDTACVDCGKKLNSPLGLRMHRITVHKLNEAEFEIPCEVPSCRRRFEKKMDLEWRVWNVHQNKEEDGPFICHECGKTCAGKTGLEKHSKRHNTPQPNLLVCEECGKVFRKQQDLKKHKLSHSGPASWKFSCSLCGKKCASKTKLMVHLRVHTKDNQFICDYCGKAYAHANNLRDHKNKKHGTNIRPRTMKLLNERVSRKGQKLPPSFFRK